MKVSRVNVSGRVLEESPPPWLGDGAGAEVGVEEATGTAVVGSSFSTGVAVAVAEAAGVVAAADVTAGAVAEGSEDGDGLLLPDPPTVKSMQAS